MNSSPPDDEASEALYRRARPYHIAALCFVFSFLMIRLFTPSFEEHRLHKTMLAQINTALELDQRISSLNDHQEGAELPLEIRSALLYKKEHLNVVDRSFFSSILPALTNILYAPPLYLLAAIWTLLVAMTLLRLGPYRKAKLQRSLKRSSFLTALLLTLTFYTGLTSPIKGDHQGDHHIAPAYFSSLANFDRAYLIHPRTLFASEQETMQSLRLQQEEQQAMFSSPSSQELRFLWELYLLDWARKVQESESKLQSFLPLPSLEEGEKTRKELLEEHQSLPTSSFLRAQMLYYATLALEDRILPPPSWISPNLWLCFLILVSILWALQTNRASHLYSYLEKE